VTDQELPVDAGDPVKDVFPPDKSAARFVVTMSMARNDIERALYDLIRSDREHGQDFTYRVRLVTGHLVEAIESINQYRQEFEAVRKLLGRVPTGDQKKLSRVVGAIQQAGKGTLEQIRHHTFHYPAPDPAYKSSGTSDAALAFREWVISLMQTYVDSTGGEIGKPIVSDKPPPKS
jgi:hypothetical protein